MLSSLQIPYFKRVQIWEVFERMVNPNSFPTVDTYLGIKKEVFSTFGVPDFISKRAIAVAGHFGKEQVFDSEGQPVEFKEPQVRLSNFINYLQNNVSLDVAAVVSEILVVEDVGRFYDADGRVYLKGYSEEEFFVRLPYGNSDGRKNQGQPVSLPFVGQKLMLIKQGYFHFYSVQTVGISSSHRKITGVITVFKTS